MPIRVSLGVGSVEFDSLAAAAERLDALQALAALAAHDRDAPALLEQERAELGALQAYLAPHGLAEPPAADQPAVDRPGSGRSSATTRKPKDG